MTRVDGQVGRVVSREACVAQVRAWQADGRTVVFTNGVFDILHPGHVRYLAAARAEGDHLVVGVNTDDTVRAAKGADRPVHPAAERAELLAALKVVDLVTIFPEPTPAALIDAVQPDVLVKGADWPLDQIVGRETVWARGGRVVRVPTEEGHSTTSIIRKIAGPATGE
ncbi:cytidylyltransferase [Luteitalea sp. TBR-22]|uniref:D-glycero-beta-D-manno-heptose 1-phosphate adenylyltransferase n=1 Tax=Luteitalea sp. TBR-22 TaxID=2802971 RepID=UPI001AFCC978|nr:D-glycero-beta-D-manno-heptose 1-phosphate adenylyltransferase [Luteitalea sp. TBR-22]BCS36106.1 cytidylyltransferase [Luteitalea sp. TBR-22]